MTLMQWADAHPERATLLFSTIIGMIVGSLGNLIANNVDGEKYPRIYQLGRIMQNLGIALPRAGERIAFLFQGARPSDPPKPISTDGKTFAVGLVLAFGGASVGLACHVPPALPANDVVVGRGQVIHVHNANGGTEAISAEELGAMLEERRGKVAP